MKIKMLVLLCALFALSLLFTACDGTKNATKGLEYTLINNSAYSVTGIGKATDSDIVIPSTYRGLPVISIGDYAFDTGTGFDPDRVTYTMDPSVLSGYSNKYMVSVSGYTGITSITIPDSVTSIGKYAFSGCTGLTSINIPDSVTYIDFYAFAGCSGLTSINIPDSVKYIGVYAFAGCSGLTSIQVADGNTVYHASGNCLIKTTSKTLVAGCQNSIIPTDGSVTSIDSSAFHSCIGLTSITIPDSVTSIGDRVFFGCIGLTSITIPDSVTSIGDRAFFGCTKLAYTNYDNGIYLGNTNNPYICLIRVNDTTATTFTIPETTKVIYSDAFSGRTEFTSITISDSVTSIGERAFYVCTGLTSITIPDSVTSIGYSAFYGCTGLTSIIIPDSVTSIGYSAFYGCTRLTSITIPDGVTSIGYYAFSYCTRLTSITIPDSVTSIGERAFEGCTGLTSITIPDSVTSIGSYAFSGCSNLTIQCEASQPSGWIFDWNPDNRPVIWGYQQ